MEVIVNFDSTEWDNFLENTDATIFHNSKWMKTFGDNVEFIVLKEGNYIIGGIAISKKKFINKNIIIPPMLCPYGDIVFNKNIFESLSKTNRISKSKKITTQIIKTLKKDSSVVIIEFSDKFKDFHPFIWEKFEVKVHHSYILKNDNEEKLFANMSATRRNDIRKAIKDGINVVIGLDKENLKKMVLKTFKRQNMNYSSSIIDKVFEATDNVKTFVAYKEDLPIAANCIVWDKKSAYYILGGYDSDNGHSGAQALAMWEAIRFSFNELKLDFFDFEGSMVPNIERFFRNFGGDLVTLHRAEYFSNDFLRYMFNFSKNNDFLKKIRKVVFKR